MQIEHIFGYRGHQCRKNLLTNSSNTHLIYFIAGVVVCYEIKSGKQYFYTGPHDDDITAITSFKNMIAVGQLGGVSR